MSNVQPTTEKAEAKQIWTRCPKCRQRVWNDRIDIEVHNQRCPADLERALKRLTKRVEDLERAEPVVLPAMEAGPRLDLEHEAPWPADEVAVPVPPAEVDEDEPFEEVPVAPTTVRSAYFDDEDD